MTTRFPLAVLPDPEKARLDPGLQDPIHYRKSGLSINHIVGCPLDCAYCIRHSNANFEMKVPKLLCSDEEVVRLLLGHNYFVAHLTPLQLLNKATDPFLPRVKEHTFSVLEMLDRQELTNHMLVITRYRVSASDCARLNGLKSLRVTLLVSYSGINDARIEPLDSEVSAASLRTAFEDSESYKVILYWRPIVPGLNDSDQHLSTINELARHAHATVFTGLFFRAEMLDYYEAAGIPLPYDSPARRKILPRDLEERVLGAIDASVPLFRKTSCGVSYAHRVEDYNGHYCVQELCDICPAEQIARCARAWKVPSARDVRAMLSRLDRPGVTYQITPNAVTVDGLDESDRYYLQHGLNFQVHDKRHPHFLGRHGRAETGWADGELVP